MIHLKALSTAALAMACSTIFAVDNTLNLWWEADMQCANVGQTVTIDVFANSTGPNPLALSDAYLAITWDPAVLTNDTPAVITEAAPWELSYWAPGSPANTNLQDGDARRELLGMLPPDFPVAPVGIMHDPTNRIKVTTFTFTVSVFAATTSVKLWGTAPNATTNFYKGDFQIGQWPLAFESGDYSEALVTPIVPFPATGFIVTEGYEFTGDINSLLTNDDVRLTMFNDEYSLAAKVEIYANSVCRDPSAVTFESESSVERLGLAVSIEFYNYTTNSFDLISGAVATFAEQVIVSTTNTQASNYVNQGDGEVRTRVGWTLINDEDPTQDGWLHLIDFVKWTMTP